VKLMSAPLFVVSVADLRRGPVEVSWPLPVAWLRRALADTQASVAEAGHLQVELTASGTRVVVRGMASAKVTMPCARTLEPVQVELSPEIFLMLSPALLRTHPDRATRSNKGRSRRGRRSAGRSSDRERSNDRPAGTKGWDGDPLLSDELAAQDSYDGERVVLDPFVREFILLDLPMNVLRTDLPPAPDAAIGPPSQSSDSGQAAEQPLDPRLAPLASIASRLRQNKE
jgi:uncharacterized protein